MFFKVYRCISLIAATRAEEGLFFNLWQNSRIFKNSQGRSLKARVLIFWFLALYIRILAPVKTEFEKSLKWWVELSPGILNPPPMADRVKDFNNRYFQTKQFWNLYFIDSWSSCLRFFMVFSTAMPIKIIKQPFILFIDTFLAEIFLNLWKIISVQIKD